LFEKPGSSKPGFFYGTKTGNFLLNLQTPCFSHWVGSIKICERRSVWDVEQTYLRLNQQRPVQAVVPALNKPHSKHRVGVEVAVDVAVAAVP
jgi:hypothetical protein